MQRKGSIGNASCNLRSLPATQREKLKTKHECVYIYARRGEAWCPVLHYELGANMKRSNIVASWRESKAMYSEDRKKP